MPIKKELLEILCCPQCRGNLDLKEETLTCGTCRLAYPIRNDIPIMLIDEAVPLF